MVDSPKTKAPRRTDAEIAADYALRAEAARVRPIKASAAYKALRAANDALGGIEDEMVDRETIAAVNEASRRIALALNYMLAARAAAVKP